MKGKIVWAMNPNRIVGSKWFVGKILWYRKGIYGIQATCGKPNFETTTIRRIT